MAEKAARALSGYVLPESLSSDTALREFQRQNGLKVDGVYGPQSKAAYEKTTSGNSQAASGRSTGRSAGYEKFDNGYRGEVIKGADGNSYTPYGALIREDGFYYPEGAKISPNGMYIDMGDGKGEQFAKYGVSFDGNGHIVGYSPGDMTGAAPGARVKGFGETFKKPKSTTQDTTGAEEEPETQVPDVDKTNDELARYWKNLIKY